MRTALALQVACFSRSLTARVATVLIVLLPPSVSVGMVAIARSGTATGPSAAKFEPYREGTFSQAVATLAGQVLPIMLMFGVGFAIAWLVGREWADRTYGSLFALPVSRTSLGWAKIAVVLSWAVVATTVACLLILAAIALFGQGTLDAEVSRQLAKVWAAGLMMCALALPFGWVAARLHGYLGAVGAIVGVTAASQVIATLGVGAWFPYVAPALWAGAGGATAAQSVNGATVIVAMAFAAFGAWATVQTFASARLD